MITTLLRKQAFWAGLLLLGAGAWPRSLAAERLTSDVDPICRLPRIQLTEADPDSLYELLASDDLESGVWQPVLKMTAGHNHAWFKKIKKKNKKSLKKDKAVRKNKKKKYNQKDKRK